MRESQVLLPHEAATRWLRRALLAVLGALVLGGTALAKDPVVVQSAYVNVRSGVFELNAHTIFPLNEDVRAALADGATISLELRAVVDRHRRYWLDATLVDITLKRELSWNEVSQRYILHETDRAEQESFQALDQALAAAGQVEGWPVVLEPQQRLVRMDIAPVKRWRGYGIIALAGVLVIGVLLLLARSVESSAQYSR